MPGKFSRRDFLKILTLAAASYPVSALAEKRQLASQQTHSLNEPWLTIAAVQQHLFPAEADSPGANDIQALHYLKNIMATPGFDKEEKTLIKNGVNWLNDLSKKQQGKKFIELDNELKEKLLRTIENSKAGQRWLSLLLTYLIEALLSDPVYGGNPNGIGWEWLQHQPGFPRPPAEKRYFKLKKYSQLRQRTTKA